MTSSVPLNDTSSFFYEINHEAAFKVAEEISKPVEHETDTTKVVSGPHPEHGDVHVIIPAMGSAILIKPVLFRSQLQ